MLERIKEFRINDYLEVVLDRIGVKILSITNYLDTVIKYLYL